MAKRSLENDVGSNIASAAATIVDMNDLDISNFLLCGIILSSKSSSCRGSSSVGGGSGDDGDGDDNDNNKGNTHTNNAGHITSLESSLGQLPFAATTVGKMGNGLPYDMHNFQIVQCHAVAITQDIIV